MATSSLILNIAAEASHSLLAHPSISYVALTAKVMAAAQRVVSVLMSIGARARWKIMPVSRGIVMHNIMALICSLSFASSSSTYLMGQSKLGGDLCVCAAASNLRA